jgi:sensor histidine kinase regulating citrate/malate metabolism
MVKNYKSEEIFGKAIGQLVHDIRNPLNTIIGFSSIIKIDDTISVELKDYINKIFNSGMAIEKLLSNIDYFMMDRVVTDIVEFNVMDSIKKYLEMQFDLQNEKEIVVNYLIKEAIDFKFSLEIFNKIIDNLFSFSLKGLRVAKKKELEIFIKKENDTLILLYTDSSSPVFIEDNYFTFEDTLNAKRGLGPMFIEKYVNIYKGSIEYHYGKKWQSVCFNYSNNIKNNHGFIIKLPELK